MLRMELKELLIRKAGFTLCPVARLEHVNEETALKILFAMYRQIGALDEKANLAEEVFFEEVIDKDKIDPSIIDSAFKDKLLEEGENQKYIITSRMIDLLEKAAKLQRRFIKTNNFYESLHGNIANILLN